MKSKTKIEKQIERKTNPELIKTIIAAKKNNSWFEIAEILSSPRRKRIDMNIEKINQETKEGERVIVPGKVLSLGEIDKKIEVVALNFSDNAKEKLLKSGCKISRILEEIKKNPEAKKIKILK